MLRDWWWTLRREVLDWWESLLEALQSDRTRGNLYCYTCPNEVRVPGDQICAECRDDPRVCCPAPHCGTPLDGDDGEPLRESQVSSLEWERLAQERCPDCSSERETAGWSLHGGQLSA